MILEEFGVTDDQESTYTSWYSTIISTGLTGDLIWCVCSAALFTYMHVFIYGFLGKLAQSCRSEARQTTDMPYVRYVLRGAIH